MKTKEEIKDAMAYLRAQKTTACKTTKTKFNYAIELLEWVISD